MKEQLIRCLEDVAEWLRTGKVAGVGFDEASVLTAVEDTLKESKTEITQDAAQELLRVCIETAINLRDYADPDGEFDATPAGLISIARELDQAISKAAIGGKR